MEYEYYEMVVGIEHLVSGITFDSKQPLEFSRQSSSTFLARSVDKFSAYWPVKQSWIEAERKVVESMEAGARSTSAGEVEWYAQVMAAAMRKADTESVEAQNLSEQLRTGLELPALPDAVVAAMRRKHGALADTFIRALRWDGFNKCWFYQYAGMYVGVEADGYIHT